MQGSSYTTIRGTEVPETTRFSATVLHTRRASPDDVKVMERVLAVGHDIFLVRPFADFRTVRGRSQGGRAVHTDNFSSWKNLVKHSLHTAGAAEQHQSSNTRRVFPLLQVISGLHCLWLASARSTPEAGVLHSDTAPECGGKRGISPSIWLELRSAREKPASKDGLGSAALWAASKRAFS